MNLKRLILQTARSLGLDIGRYNPGFPTGIVSLPPDGISKGNVLLAYILEPFLSRGSKPISTSHTHHGESVLIADTWLQQGYSVDVIDYRNHEFVPRKRYDFFVSARTHLETIAARLNPDCVTIAHLDTSHYAFNNEATYRRLLETQKRRGVSLPGSTRLIEHNMALESADYGVVLGNEKTVDSYRYAGKPLFALSAPTVTDLPWNDEKDFDACRNHFLWFGSGGLVHKGLDIVLEAFADMPEAHLTVCGPIESESMFCNEYRMELYETKNIRLAGWVDVNGDEFRQIVRQCAAIVYPSCAEGQATSVLNCMRGGLIPILTPEAGISIGDFGVSLERASITSIKDAVRRLAALPPDDLAARARRTWEYTDAHHSRVAYQRHYAAIIKEIAGLSSQRRALTPPPASPV